MLEKALMGDPISFNEAFYHKDSEKRNVWREAIKKSAKFGL
jgi:hypothetical protein